MLPYQEDGKKLERLLERLFEDDDGSAPEDIEVLKEPGLRPFRSCCSHSYGDYN